MKNIRLRCWSFVLLLVGLVLASPAAWAAVFYPTSFTLANGLQVVVVPNHLAPVVTQMVWYKIGSSYEEPGKTGLAHYLEHLMFRGTSAIGPGEFSKIIAAQGGNENAFTSYDYTAFHETVAADRLPMIMQMEADRMQNLRIVPETATPELSVVLDERQQRTDNSPEGRFSEKLNHLLMPHYPYGVPVIGWKKEIEKLSAADARSFYDSHYAPNNAVVVISGDVVPDDVMRLAAAVFGPIPRKDIAPPHDLPPLPLPSQRQFAMVDAGVEQPQVEIQTVVPSYSTSVKDDKREAYAYEVLAEALDGGEAGLLYRYLVKEKRLASAVGTNYDPDARGDVTFTIAATPSPNTSIKKLESGMQDYLQMLAGQTQPTPGGFRGLDTETVAAAKERLNRSAIFARDSMIMPGYAFGMALSTGHNVQDVEDWPHRVSAVTTDEVKSALIDLINNPHSIVASLAPDKHASAAEREAAHPVINHDSSIR